jgi:hypothetical protein
MKVRSRQQDCQAVRRFEFGRPERPASGLPGPSLFSKKICGDTLNLQSASSDVRVPEQWIKLVGGKFGLDEAGLGGASGGASHGRRIATAQHSEKAGGIRGSTEPARGGIGPGRGLEAPALRALAPFLEIGIQRNAQ